MARRRRSFGKRRSFKKGRRKGKSQYVKIQRGGIRL